MLKNVNIRNNFYREMLVLVHLIKSLNLLLSVMPNICMKNKNQSLYLTNYSFKHLK